MNKIKAIGLYCMLLLLGACNSNLDEVPFLELSENATVEFAAEGGQKSITVNTNYTKWVPTSNAEWLKVNQVADGFTLTADANMGKERKAEVIIYAGGETKRMMVEQAASTSKLLVSQDKVEVDQFEHKVDIVVKSALGEWSVEEGLPDWITVGVSPKDNTLALTIKENTDKAARIHKLFIKTKDEVKEILVTQAGIMHLILPYLIPDSSSEDVRKFEEGRKSVLQDDAKHRYGAADTYVTKSSAFRAIEYTLDNRKGVTSIMMMADNVTTTTSEEFLKLLTDNGFVFAGNNGVELVYTKETTKDGASYDIVANIAYGRSLPELYQKVLFRFIRGQKNPHPTFKELPMGIGALDVTMDGVAAWESTHGGTMSKEKSYVNNEGISDLFYDVFDHIYVTRRYVFSKEGRLLNMHLFLYDVNKLFYETPDGFYHLTKEFKKLLKNSGFTETRRSDDPNSQFKLFYINPKKKIAFAFRVGHYKEVNDGIPVAHVLAVPVE